MARAAVDAFGLLNINKPSGPTSHDLVAAVRRGTRVKKVGHAGTLDPLASGVLVVCLGPATRLSEYAMRSIKRYRARVRFGVETDTYDAEGQIVAERDPSALDRGTVVAALEPLRGEIEQVPPMYSAIKQGGKKLYELARAGEQVERPARTVTIAALDLIAWEPPDVVLDVTCSPGTYIRTLAHDLGAALGVGAHLAALERTASGAFTVDDAVAWDALQAAFDADGWRDYLLPPDCALAGSADLRLDDAAAADVVNGRWIAAEPGEAGEIARAYDPAGRFIAVLERRAGAETSTGAAWHWKPHKVFSAR